MYGIYRIYILAELQSTTKLMTTKLPTTTPTRHDRQMPASTLGISASLINPSNTRNHRWTTRLQHHVQFQTKMAMVRSTIQRLRHHPNVDRY